MTVSITACKVIVPGNGVQTTFNYNFEVPVGSLYALIYTDASGNETTLSTSAYSVAGLGNAIGGTFTYPLSGSPIATGTSLTFLRETQNTQPTSLINQGSYSASLTEGALDWIVYQVQQLAQQVGQALQIPAVDPQGLITTLPPAAIRAGSYAAFDSLGNLIATTVPVASSTVPAVNGSATAGASPAWARGDHVHPTDTSRAPASGPTFTGSVIVPTPTTAMQAATKAYVNGVSCALASVAALRLNTVLANAAFVAGHFAAGDGGGGWFSCVATDTTSADNGGTIIVDASSRRWYRVTEGAATSIAWFGGLPGVADCTAALNAALAAIAAPGGTIYFPRGTYTFASLISYNIPAGEFSIGFEGAGADATVLYWPSTSGISISASNALHTVHFRDMSITTGSTTATLTGILVTNSVQGGAAQQSDFFRVTFRGSDGGAGSKIWGIGLSIVGQSFVNYDSCIWYGCCSLTGTGLEVQGVASGNFKYSLVHNLCKCSFFTLGIGFIYGTYVQGVSISQCNFTNGVTDIYLPTPAFGASQLTITASQFAGSGERIIINGPLAQLIMSSNLFFVAGSQIGLAINGMCCQAAVVGNVFTTLTATGTYGIIVNAVGDGAITGNFFYGLAVGIDFTSRSGGWNCQSNTWSGNTQTISNSGTGNIIGGGTC